MKSWITKSALCVGLMTSAIFSHASDSFTCADDGQLSQAQCKNLVDIYTSTQGATWSQTQQTPWLSTANPCDWTGVVCWGDKVARLEFVNTNMSGTMPALNDLPHLVDIAFIGNPQLSGAFPDLSHLKALRNLVVFNNGFEGFLPDFAKFNELTQAIMFNNHFTGPIPDTEHLNNLVIFGNNLCLSPQVTHNKWADRVASYSTCAPMMNDVFQGDIDLSQFGVIANDNRDDAGAINHVLSMLALTQPQNAGLANVTFRLPVGEINLQHSIRLRDFSNVTFTGADSSFVDTQSHNASSVSVLKKLPNFARNDHRSGSIINAAYGAGLTVKNLTFEGSHSDTNSAYMWWDNGLYVGSSSNTRIHDNHFQHLGDAAIHIVTDKDDARPGINSSDTEIRQNSFYNIMQTSTTSPHGGTRDIRFIDNNVQHLKGSIKFASRREGAQGILVKNNTIRSAGSGGISTNNGIEIEGYSDITISNNNLANGQGVGIVVRSPQNKNMQGIWDWGDVLIDTNTIANYRQAVYISNLPHLMLGTTPFASNITVEGNQFNDMHNADAQAMVHFVGNQFSQASVSNNTFVGGTYTVWPGPQTWLTKIGNVHLL